jgi:hypothetical protein
MLGNYPMTSQLVASQFHRVRYSVMLEILASAFPPPHVNRHTTHKILESFEMSYQFSALFHFCHVRSFHVRGYEEC